MTGWRLQRDYCLRALMTQRVCVCVCVSVTVQVCWWWTAHSSLTASKLQLPHSLIHSCSSLMTSPPQLFFFSNLNPSIHPSFSFSHSLLLSSLHAHYSFVNIGYILCLPLPPPQTTPLHSHSLKAGKSGQFSRGGVKRNPAPWLAAGRRSEPAYRKEVTRQPQRGRERGWGKERGQRRREEGREREREREKKKNRAERSLA